MARERNLLNLYAGSFQPRLISLKGSVDVRKRRFGGEEGGKNEKRFKMASIIQKGERLNGISRWKLAGNIFHLRWRPTRRASPRQIRQIYPDSSGKSDTKYVYLFR